MCGLIVLAFVVLSGQRETAPALISPAIRGGIRRGLIGRIERNEEEEVEGK
jgi:hypothetical protein